MAQSLSSAAEHSSLSNSAARAETIRDAVQQQAEYEAQLKAINAELREFKTKTIKGNLGFKLSDWSAVYRVSQLQIEDRDALLECVREGFAALHIGGIVDWVAAAEASPLRHRNGAAAPDEAARTAGYQDGISGDHDRADQYPQGSPGHGDYELGVADGQAERDRVMALGDDGPRPRRRGRPPGSRNRPKPEVEPRHEGAEF